MVCSRPCLIQCVKVGHYHSVLIAGDLLCFLHADTQPPKELVAVVRGVMNNSKNALGGFRTIIQTDGKRLHGMTLHHLVKTYYIAALLRPLAFVR